MYKESSVSTKSKIKKKSMHTLTTRKQVWCGTHTTYCFTAEEYFIISITFISNFYIVCFVVDELPSFTVIVNNF